MKWENRGQSRNVVDNRGRGRRARGGVSLGIGGFLVLLVLSLVFQVDLFSLLGVTTSVNNGNPGAVTSSQPGTPGAAAGDAQLVGFVSAVLDDSQQTWAGIFEQNGLSYKPATLSLESGKVPSACGMVPAAAGPFYCLLDSTIYLNLAFYDELRNRYGAPGDAAEAYVIAHELGHHIQHLLRVTALVQQAQRANPAEANRLSVALELQADCYAGVWGSDRTNKRVMQMTKADFHEAITAAAAIGDDRLQKQATGQVEPDSFTHGSSQQRVHWFERGFNSGNPDSCDTFRALDI